jgi:1-deoxy-D-xylulose 5-phosphate reductoisomerase
MNAANEEAVYSFLKGEISYNNIYEIVEHVFEKFPHSIPKTIDEIFELDNKVRQETQDFIKRLK